MYAAAQLTGLIHKQDSNLNGARHPGIQVKQIRYSEVAGVDTNCCHT